MPRGGRRSSTSFKPGRSGNPSGRPKGSKDVMPRVRDLFNRVMEGSTEAAEAALQRALTSPRTVLACLELGAKLNREIGQAAGDGASGAPIVIFASNVQVGKLEAARARALPARAEDA